MIQVAIAFAVIAVAGLFAAKRPDTFARFLQEWQRQRLGENMGAVSLVGWVVFGACALMAIVLLIADLVRGL